MAILTWLGVPGERDKWSALAFNLGQFGGCDLEIGGICCTIDTTPSWGFDELFADTAPLGVPTRAKPSAFSPHENDWSAHANRITGIDHIVYAVSDLDAAVDALKAVLGEPPKRRAFPRGPSGPEMAFFTVGHGCFIEVVASGRPAALWGIAFRTDDLDGCVAAIREEGGPIGDPKPAVQGGRIASVWKEHVGWGVAVMEPPR
jgi:catechol 2,3-dioxygenase-like lactoylglutathione lyase family enzyme